MLLSNTISTVPLMCVTWLQRLPNLTLFSPIDQPLLTSRTLKYRCHWPHKSPWYTCRLTIIFSSNFKNTARFIFCNWWLFSLGHLLVDIVSFLHYWLNLRLSHQQTLAILHNVTSASMYCTEWHPKNLEPYKVRSIQYVCSTSKLRSASLNDYPFQGIWVSEWVIWGLTSLWHYFGLIATRTRFIKLDGLMNLVLVAMRPK